MLEIFEIKEEADFGAIDIAKRNDVIYPVDGKPFLWKEFDAFFHHVGRCLLKTHKASFYRIIVRTMVSHEMEIHCQLSIRLEEANGDASEYCIRVSELRLKEMKACYGLLGEEKTQVFLRVRSLASLGPTLFLDFGEPLELELGHSLQRLSFTMRELEDLRWIQFRDE